MAEQKKATMGKYIAEHGIINAIRHFTAEFPEGALKESSPRVEEGVLVL